MNRRLQIQKAMAKLYKIRKTNQEFTGAGWPISQKLVWKRIMQLENAHVGTFRD